MTPRWLPNRPGGRLRPYCQLGCVAVFNRRNDPVIEPASESNEGTDGYRPTTPPKGRPTPSRKEAEAARKQSMKLPKDPKAAKRAMRERDREARATSRAALLSGDERALPARDAGPVRSFTRDFVDSRRSLAEYFIVVAFLVLILGFVRNPALQLGVSLFWLLATVLIVVDTIWMLRRLSKALTERWPDKADRKGAAFYAGLRALQLRRLRLPKPKVAIGGTPVVRRTKR